MNADLRVKSADALNGTAVILTFEGEPALEANLVAEVSEDEITWKKAKMEGSVVVGLPSVKGSLRVLSGGQRSNAIPFDLSGLEMSGAESRAATTPPPVSQSDDANANTTDGLDFCTFKGHNYTLGECY